MKRTTENSFDAMLECISQLDCSPIEILLALKSHFDWRSYHYRILRKPDDEYPEITREEISGNLKTLVDSIDYVKADLSDFATERRELTYDDNAQF